MNSNQLVIAIDPGNWTKKKGTGTGFASYIDGKYRYVTLWSKKDNGTIMDKNEYFRWVVNTINIITQQVRFTDKNVTVVCEDFNIKNVPFLMGDKVMIKELIRDIEVLCLQSGYNFFPVDPSHQTLPTMYNKMLVDMKLKTLHEKSAMRHLIRFLKTRNIID